MALLQVRDIDNHLYAALKNAARADNRSISQEVISILNRYLANPAAFQNDTTRDFLALSGAWSDDRPPEKIISDIKARRKNSRRFGTENALFD